MDTNPVRTALATLPILLAVIAGCPAVAFSQNGSAIDQYQEHLPGPGGEDTSSGGAVTGEPGGDLPDDALEQLGPGGERAAALAEATGSPNEGKGHPQSSAGDHGAGGPSSVASQLVDPPSDGIGLVLPLALVAILFAGIVAVLRRRIGSDGDSAPAA